jgi:hypothetical protein
VVNAGLCAHLFRECLRIFCGTTGRQNFENLACLVTRSQALSNELHHLGEKHSRFQWWIRQDGQKGDFDPTLGIGNLWKLTGLLDVRNTEAIVGEHVEIIRDDFRTAQTAFVRSASAHNSVIFAQYSKLYTREFRSNRKFQLFIALYRTCVHLKGKGSPRHAAAA